MVYDNTLGTPEFTGKSGFAIHKNAIEHESPTYEIYTDDGHGNGDYVCGSDSLGWIRTIAYALDDTKETE